MARILLAISPPARCLLCSALINHEIVEATTFNDAQKLSAQNGIDLFVICMDFDESRGLELVNRIRGERKHEQTPLLAIRLRPSEMTDVITKIMGSMKNLGIINDYIELENSLASELQVKTIVEQLLTCEKNCNSIRKRFGL